MRLKVSKSKNAASFYVTKTIYEKGKERTLTVEKLGTEQSLRETLNGDDPYEWAKAYVHQLNQQEKEANREIILRYSPTQLLTKEKQQLFNGGYLFLQDIYYDLGLDKICKKISEKYKFSYDLNAILSRLIYGRILFPSSKKATTELSLSYFEEPNFDLHHVYRGLEILAKEMDMIQAHIYKNSLKLYPRNTKILYYDCTNFFFEIEEEHGLKQYGKSKENRPTPIVQMGLFMDGDGLPLSFCINKGNTNEQVTLKPLEKKMLADFDLSQFIVCTDAGLASTSNRKFNALGRRAFITTQSVKQLKKHLKEWALDPTGWRISGETHSPVTLYDLSKLDPEDPSNLTRVFYKERWINENELEQRLIVTYSLKYARYQQTIRKRQIERAQKLIDSSPKKIGKPKPNDFKRFITQTSVTPNGEKAEKTIFSLSQEIIEKEAKYDGFYAVCTNVESTVEEIIKINQGRWEIEESFRIMKTEMEARPVYLSRDDRITAHFGTCFISLIIYRLLEKKLEEKFTCAEIMSGLKDMRFLDCQGEGYRPTYTRTDFTDALHEAFGFRTDYCIVTTKEIKKILKQTKSTKKVRSF